MRVNLVSVILAAALSGCKSDIELVSAPPPGEINPVDLDNPVVEDVILQLTPPVVDVLWLVDNSCSMEPYQAALTASFDQFVEYFVDSGLDYHIGVVSTDMDDPNHSGKLRQAAGQRWIDLDTSNPLQSFTLMAGMGASGSGYENGREALYTALELEKDGFNDGFLRDDEEGGVHAIVISNEPDDSGPNPINEADFAEYLNGLRPDADLVTVNSIVSFSGARRGTQYLNYTALVGGAIHDIDDPDWPSVLDDLGVQAAGLKREYFLSQLPVQSTIEVKVELSNGITTLTFTQEQYTYSSARNSITFVEFVPPPLARVRIEYTLLSSVVDEDVLE